MTENRNNIQIYALTAMVMGKAPTLRGWLDVVTLQPEHTELALQATKRKPVIHNLGVLPILKSYKEPLDTGFDALSIVCKYGDDGTQEPFVFRKAALYCGGNELLAMILREELRKGLDPDDEEDIEEEPMVLTHIGDCATIFMSYNIKLTPAAIEEFSSYLAQATTDLQYERRGLRFKAYDKNLYVVELQKANEEVKVAQ